MEDLALLTAKPWYTGRTSAAALVRKIADEAPTLLLDESDAAFGGEKEYAQTLRGILNSGHRIGGKASLCVGQGKDITVRDFSTFSPKAIAGLGKLPDTVADRSIPIELKRAVGGELPERFRKSKLQQEATELLERLAEWTPSIFEILDDAEPYLPEALSDRQQDGEPLLAIADAAGGDWPFRARDAFVSILSDSDRAESNGTRLLADIRSIFEEKQCDRVCSHDLVTAVTALETAPWSEWNHGKPITPAGLSRLLKPFRIGPHNIRLGQDKVSKGYETADFHDAWTRYLSPSADENATALQPAKDATIPLVRTATGGHRVTVPRDTEPANNGPRSGVAVFDRGTDWEGQLEGLGIS